MLEDRSVPASVINPTGALLPPYDPSDHPLLGNVYIGAVETGDLVDVMHGDFNGDGRTDFVGRRASDGLWFAAFGTADGFDTSKTFGIWDASITWLDLRVGDFNDDGRDDIAGRDGETGQWFIGFAGEAGFTQADWTTWDANVEWKDVFAADLNGDGKADLIGRNATTGEWQVALTLENASNATNATWDAWDASVNWSHVRLGDFNGDDRLDLAGYDPALGLWHVGINNGGGFSTSAVGNWAPEVDWDDAAFVDLNGDGLADVIARDRFTGQWWAGLSDGASLANQYFAVWTGDNAWEDHWDQVTFADFNGDGKTDVVGRVRSDGTWWAGLSTGVRFDCQGLGEWSTNVTWLGTAAVDVDGDGTLELVGLIKEFGDFWKGAPIDLRFRGPDGVATKIAGISPQDGDTGVDLQRLVLVRFERPVDISTVTADSFYVTIDEVVVPGVVWVSPSGLFATYTFDDLLAENVAVRVYVDGDLIYGVNGLKLDADNDGLAGGMGYVEFVTLSTELVPNTRVFGYVYDAYTKNEDGTDRPLTGVTLALIDYPNIFVETDENGYFELGLQDLNSDEIPDGLPAHSFLVEIDASGAPIPMGFKYASFVISLQSVAGQRTQISLGGVPFNIYLPLVPDSDVVELPEDGILELMLGPGGADQVLAMYPDDPALAQSIIDTLKLTYRGGSGVDAGGTPATHGFVSLLARDRLLVPPPAMHFASAAVLFQTGSSAYINYGTRSTRFLHPVTLEMPNIDQFASLSKALLWFFDETSNEWLYIGSGTVSADGSKIVTDAGVGMIAPGYYMFTAPN